jgi:hypothetical protein
MLGLIVWSARDDQRELQFPLAFGFTILLLSKFETDTMAGPTKYFRRIGQITGQSKAFFDTFIF